jgi:dGTPase
MKDLLDQREREFLSPLASFSQDGLRRSSELLTNDCYRQEFSLDADRILNSLAYTRYIDKTQVFSLIRNDHITHRVLHVQLVSRIARTIGRFLGLNEDLIEAASLGHDLGHPPFGHDGERILSKLCLENGAGFFHHNLQSIQFLERLERSTKGWNLTLQTLDAILCHNGEVHSANLKPERTKNFSEFDRALIEMKTQENPDPIPMTLEGCAVRIADTIAYVGRDMEDALRLNLIQRSDLPQIAQRLLGTTNGTIVYNLTTDLIANSHGQPILSFTQDVSEALRQLKAFNYTRIYSNPEIKQHLAPVKEIYRYLFETFLNDLETGKPMSRPLCRFYEGLADKYLSLHSHAEVVRDFIAGMTDSFFIRQAPESMRPHYIEK